METVVDFNDFDEKIDVENLKKLITETEYINNLPSLDYLYILFLLLIFNIVECV